MEMQLTNSRSRNRSSSEIRGIKRNRVVKIGIIIAGILIAICIFIGGYHAGANSASKLNNMESPSRILPAYVSDIKWSGQCPTKLPVCPKSYHGVPPLILISLDGFRPDYLNRGYTPTLDNIAQCGTRAPYMYPVFPSKTFPNHYSIVTGLHPQYHGIVDNSIYDPDTDETFKMGQPVSFQPYWWEAEPIWVTAVNQGKKAHCFFWAGSDVEIKGVRPTLYMKYDKTIDFGDRVKTILKWLDLPFESRPNFITLYMRQPDASGHDFGPTSYEVNQALTKVDKTVAKLFYGLQQRGLLNCVNVMIISDHGMTSVECSQVVNLQNYINTINVVSTYGVYGRIKLKDGNNETTVEEIISDLKCKNEHMKVYKKPQLPVRFHYSHHKRIEPIFVEMDYGWILGPEIKESACSGGTHGYDNYVPDMRALFMTYGPAFKSHNLVKPFQNIELYELMTEIMNITANPNNGTKGSLHHCLQNPRTLFAYENKSEPLIVGVVPIGIDSSNYADNCPCTQRGIVEQQDVMNFTLVYDKHLPFGVPLSQEHNVLHRLLTNIDYVAAYDSQYRLPLWSSFTLHETDTKEIEPCWKVDARIPFQQTPVCSDYNKTNAIDQDIVQRPLFPLSFASAPNIEDASLVTNSVPKSKSHVTLVEQHFNWLLASWVQLKGPLNVIAGPAFDIQGTGVYPGSNLIMQTRAKYEPLVVPTHYFYVITWCDVEPRISIQDCKPLNLSVAAFLLPNVPVEYNCENPSDFIKKNLARVVDVEALAGMTFFPKLPIYEAIRLRTMVPEI